MLYMYSVALRLVDCLMDEMYKQSYGGKTHFTGDKLVLLRN